MDRDKTKLEKIRGLHRFTELGLTECKRALEENSGDYFAALCTLLTPERFKEKDAAFRIRELAGDSILDPVTLEETQLMERLRQHFEVAAIGPHCLIFATQHLPQLLLGDPQWFDRLVADSGSSWLAHVWAQVGDQLPGQDRAIDESPSVRVSLEDGVVAALIALPLKQERTELHFVFILRQQRRLRFFRRSDSIRYFLVSEIIPAPENNLVVAEELLMRAGEVVFGPRLEAQNVPLSPVGLVEMLSD